jgi:hypothetical protein
MRRSAIQRLHNTFQFSVEFNRSGYGRLAMGVFKSIHLATGKSRRQPF